MMNSEGALRPAHKCDSCIWIPHPISLYQITCAVCRTSHKTDLNIARYNQNRRNYRSVLGLTSMMVRLYAKSRGRIIDLCQGEFDIHSNTPNVHITLVEGLVPKPRERLHKAIVEALWVNNQVQVVGFQCIPTKRRKPKRVLVVLELHLCGSIHKEKVLERAFEDAMLPQYPLHCTAGTTMGTNVSKLESSDFLVRCQQLEIYINPHSLEELPPPPMEGDKTVRRRMAEVLISEAVL